MDCALSFCFRAEILVKRGYQNKAKSKAEKRFKSEITIQSKNERDRKFYQDFCKLAKFLKINYDLLSTFCGLFVFPKIKIDEKWGTKIWNFGLLFAVSRVGMILLTCKRCYLYPSCILYVFCTETAFNEFHFILT